MTSLKIILLLIILLLGIAYLYPTKPKIIMSYWTPEDTFITAKNKMEVDKRFAAKVNNLNVIAYAFLHVNSDGRIFFNKNDLGSSLKNNNFCKNNLAICNQNNKLLEVGNFDLFTAFPNASGSLKKIISIGGAGDINSFFNAINNSNNFINSVYAIIEYYNLSGIDLDFEINRPYQSFEANKYADLILKLRKKLNRDKLITLTSILDKETIKSTGINNWKTITENSDFVSLMCYDLISPLFKPYYTGFNSNLYLIPNTPNALIYNHVSCDASIKYLMSLGVSPTKIVMGIPAYGIAYGGVETENNGLFQPSNPALTPSFDRLGKGLINHSTISRLNQNGFIEYSLVSNGIINGVWSYNPSTKQFLTYDNIASMQPKIKYILNNRLAGAMIWRIGQDEEVDNHNSILRIIVDGLKN